MIVVRKIPQIGFSANDNTMQVELERAFYQEDTPTLASHIRIEVSPGDTETLRKLIREANDTTIGLVEREFSK